MDLRSVLSWATVRPRYSVSRTAVELSNSPSSSATAASLFAMAYSSIIFVAHRGSDVPPEAAGAKKKAPVQTHGAESQRTAELASHTCAGPHLSGSSVVHARQPAVFGSVQATG